MKARIWTVPLSWEHTTGSIWCGNTRREGVGTWSGGESVGGLEMGTSGAGRDGR